MTCKKFHDFTEKIIAIAEAPFARMAIADAVEGKGKRKLIEQESPEEETESTNASSTSDSDSDSSDSDSDEEEVTQDYLNSLLEKARQNYAALETSSSTQKTATEDVLVLDADDSEKPLPSLEPGKVPAPYFKFEDPASGSRLSIRDPEVESAEKAFSAISGPAPPIPPPELTKSGKPLTLKEKKQLKKKTAGPDWFELPAPSESELPRLYREVEALRLRNQLDPKRFYRKDEGEGKGIKGLPKYFAIGTVLPTSTPFGTASSDNLTRANRKRTLVDELVDDAETRHYAKKKFNELQGDRHAKGRRTLAAKKALRKPKW